MAEGALKVAILNLPLKDNYSSNKISFLSKGKESRDGLYFLFLFLLQHIKIKMACFIYDVRMFYGETHKHKCTCRNISGHLLIY